MRCNNCGWENPDSTDFCYKCNKVLSVRPSFKGAETVLGYAENRIRNSVASSKISSAGKDEDGGVRVCSGCGYPATKYSENCPYCGDSLFIGRELFRLVLLSGQGGDIELREGCIVEIKGNKYRFGR